MAITFGQHCVTFPHYNHTSSAVINYGVIQCILIMLMMKKSNDNRRPNDDAKLPRLSNDNDNEIVFFVMQMLVIMNN